MNVVFVSFPAFLGWVSGVILGILTIYICTRLCSHAYFRSRKEYDLWKVSHPDIERSYLSWLQKINQEE